MQPIVILGGFLSYAASYRGMLEAVAAWSGRPVLVAPVQSLDWLPAVTRLGWVRLLDTLDRAVRKAARSSPDGKVILVGHSAGGVLARLYLSPDPFLGKVYAGLDRVGHLITLGSPHHNRGGLTHGGRMSNWVERRYPGAFFAPQVRYTSAAGRAARGDRSGSGIERRTYYVYKDICGDGNAWGDGLIPVQAALLNGSEKIELAGVFHHPLFGSPWYGSPSVIPLWLSGGGEDDVPAELFPGQPGA